MYVLYWLYLFAYAVKGEGNNYKNYSGVSQFYIVDKMDGGTW